MNQWFNYIFGNIFYLDRTVMFWIETCKLEKSQQKKTFHYDNNNDNNDNMNAIAEQRIFFLSSSESQYLFLVPTETRVEQRLLAPN